MIWRKLSLSVNFQKEEGRRALCKYLNPVEGVHSYAKRREGAARQSDGDSVHDSTRFGRFSEGEGGE